MMLLITNQARNQSDQKPKNPEMRASNKSATGRRETKTLESRAGDEENKNKKCLQNERAFPAEFPYRREKKSGRVRVDLRSTAAASARLGRGRRRRLRREGRRRRKSGEPRSARKAPASWGVGSGDGWVQKIVKRTLLMHAVCE